MPKVEDSKTGAVVSWLFLMGLFVICWYWGFQIGATALTDPDTCWLLAVGRWILAHGALPQSDPFSWTLHDQTGVYLPYQWLATLCFFALYSTFGAKSLLFFVSFGVCLSFLVLPLYLARRSGASILGQGLISVLAVSAGSFHFPLRPELFSYLFLMIVLFFVLATMFAGAQKHSGPIELSELAAEAPSATIATAAPTRSNLRSYLRSNLQSFLQPYWPSFLLGLVIFAVWANLHSGFVLGLLVLATALFSVAIYTAIAIFPLGAVSKIDNCDNSCMISLGGIFGGAIVGSLITPFQLRLYSYLPQLFFSPMNRFNQELLPLRPHELLSYDYAPFLILQLLFVFSLGWIVFSFARLASKATPDRSRAPGLVYTAALCFGLLTLVSFVGADGCRRMIPFAVLICCPYFISLSKILWPVDPRFNKFTAAPRRFALVVAAAFAFIGFGTAASASVFPATIPQTTFVFETPEQAVDFVKKNRPSGNLLNDPQYGDVLILATNEAAGVFIDTRFDLYGPKLCRDYFTMANGLSGYETLLENYKIDWMFFPPRAPIVRKLSKNASWQTVYQDRTAVIMSRQKREAK